MSEGLQKEDLYQLQESVLVLLQSMNDSQLVTAKLCGGTALSRCWIDHRVSYDLDFFLPEGFKARKIAEAMKRAGINYQTKEIVDDSRHANQLHGYVAYDGNLLKVSFIEDAYFDLYPLVEKTFGGCIVQTEGIPGLYHRKLRTVAGHGFEGDSFEGGRQKARDVFDLYVLSEVYMPITKFMESLPYTFPSSAFNNGLASMPWFDLVDELEEIVCDKKWNHVKDVAFLQNALYEQIGAVLVEQCLDDSTQVVETNISKPKYSAAQREAALTAEDVRLLSRIDRFLKTGNNSDLKKCYNDIGGHKHKAVDAIKHADTDVERELAEIRYEILKDGNAQLKQILDKQRGFEKDSGLGI